MEQMNSKKKVKKFYLYPGFFQRQLVTKKNIVTSLKVLNVYKLTFGHVFIINNYVL